MRGGLITLGVVMMLAGAVFAGQGLGYIPGSLMTNDMKWFWIGSVMVLVGLGVGAAGIGRGRKSA